MARWVGRNLFNVLKNIDNLDKWRQGILTIPRNEKNDFLINN